MIEVAESTVTLVAAFAPKWTAVAPVRLVPLIVTVFPPAVRPDVGLTAVSVGGPPWYGLDVAITVSDVVCRDSVEDVDTSDGLVTPSSSTVTVVLAAMVLVDPRKQTAMLLALPALQLPREAPPPTVTLLLTSVRTFAVLGRVIVIWLFALPDIPPVLEVVNEYV